MRMFARFGILACSFFAISSGSCGVSPAPNPPVSYAFDPRIHTKSSGSVASAGRDARDVARDEEDWPKLQQFMFAEGRDRQVHRIVPPTATPVEPEVESGVYRTSPDRLQRSVRLLQESTRPIRFYHDVQVKESAIVVTFSPDSSMQTKYAYSVLQVCRDLNSGKAWVATLESVKILEIVDLDNNKNVSNLIKGMSYK